MASKIDYSATLAAYKQELVSNEKLPFASFCRANGVNVVSIRHWMEDRRFTVRQLKEEARRERCSSPSFVSFLPDSPAEEQPSSVGKAVGGGIVFPNGVHMTISEADPALMATVLRTLQKGGM